MCALQQYKEQLEALISSARNFTVRLPPHFERFESSARSLKSHLQEVNKIAAYLKNSTHKFTTNLQATISMVTEELIRAYNTEDNFPSVIKTSIFILLLGLFISILAYKILEVSDSHNKAHQWFQNTPIIPSPYLTHQERKRREVKKLSKLRRSYTTVGRKRGGDGDGYVSVFSKGGRVRGELVASKNKRRKTCGGSSLDLRGLDGEEERREEVEERSEVEGVGLGLDVKLEELGTKVRKRGLHEVDANAEAAGDAGLEKRVTRSVSADRERLRNRDRGLSVVVEE